MRPIKSFTVKSKGGVLRQLITECEISAAFTVPYRGTEPIKMLTFSALWDTGATNCVISKKVVDQLNLKPTGVIQVEHTDGVSVVSTYEVNLKLPNDVGFMFITVSEGKLQGFDVLIGMDIIAHGDFALTNVGGLTTFSFRIPSIEEIDYNKGKPTVISTEPITPRNSPCHCGSGKKYKQCHGRNPAV